MHLTIDIAKRAVTAATDGGGTAVPPGRLLFAYGEKPTIGVTLVSGNTPVTPSGTYVLAVGDDWRLSSTPLAVAEATASGGSLSFDVSFRTPTMRQYTDGARTRPAWLWLYQRTNDAIVPLCAHLVHAHGSVYDDGTPPEDEVRTTYTRAEVDALIDSISSATVDDELSPTSEHPVQNKVITLAMQGKQAAPATPGQPGQFLALDVNGDPAFVPPPSGGDTQADWDESDPSEPSYIRNKPNLASVATSGSYEDLTDKPTIPPAQVQADWDESDSEDASYIQNKPALASVATSGSYADLTGKPDLDSEQVATSTDATLTLAPDSAGVTDWSPVADATLTLGAGWGAAKEYYYCVYLNLAQNSTLTLGAGLVFDNSQGTADSVAGGYTNVLLVCVRPTGGIVSVLNQRSA